MEVFGLLLLFFVSALAFMPLYLVFQAITDQSDVRLHQHPPDEE